MSAFSEHAEALEEAMADHGQVINWDNRDWTVATGGAGLRRPLEAGGFSFDADLECVCLADQFTEHYKVTAETIRDRMINTHATYRTRIYRIDSVNISTDGLQLRIQASDANQKA